MQTCSQCGQENPDGFRFCGACGAKLTTQEIKDAREAGGPFLCSVHALEESPADELASDPDA